MTRFKSGLFGATCQARSTLISGVAALSAWSDISQSSVVTHLRCGGIYSDSFITNNKLSPDSDNERILEIEIIW